MRDVETLLSGTDMTQQLHRHSFFYVLVLEKGIGEHCIDFIPYTLNNHSVFFMRPGQVHQLVLKSGSKGFLMEFTKDFYAPSEKAANDVLRRVSNKNLCSLDADRFRKLQTILTGIAEEYARKQERYPDVIRSGLNIFFIELLRQSRRPATSVKDNTDYQQELLEEFQELIEQHASAYKQVTYYTKTLHVTAYQLNAVTKALLGKTCLEVINDHIILEAKRYLLATVSQVSQIAWQLGYEDAGYFSRFFKKQTSYTPEAFRQKYK